jgi:hypothetical protein
MYLDTESDAYVLSIPAFRWFKVSGSYSNRNEAGLSTAQYVGRGQILALDGLYWNGSVNNTGNTIASLGIVDLHTLSWQFAYKSTVEDYYVNPGIAGYYEESTPSSTVWDSDGVYDLFVGPNAPQNRFWNHTTKDTTDSTTTMTSGSTLSSGAISGIVLGAVFLAASIVCLLIWLWFRWRNRKAASQARKEAAAGVGAANDVAYAGPPTAAGLNGGRFEKPELPATEVQRPFSELVTGLAAAATGVRPVDQRSAMSYETVPGSAVSRQTSPPSPPSSQPRASGPSSEHVEVEGSLAERYELEPTPSRRSLQPPSGPQEPRPSHSTDELYGE